MYPISYDLYLHPDVDSGLFSGQEKIRINCTEGTDKIYLHSLYITIKQVYLEGSGTSVKKFYLDSVREFLVIELNEQIVAPRVFNLGIIFEGSMKNKIIGLYSSSYLKADNTRK